MGGDQLITGLDLQLRIGEGRQLANHAGGAWAGGGLEVVPPEAAIGMEDQQHRLFGLHQPGGHQGYQFEKTVDIGAAAQGKTKAGEQLLMAALLMIETVNQWAQRTSQPQNPLGLGKPS